MKNTLFKFLTIYICSLAIGTSLLVLSFSFEGDVNKKASTGIEYIESHNKYPKILQDFLPVSWKYLIGSWSDYLQADRPTEGAMLSASIKKSENILEAAMVPSYARYWHGYVVFMRPLLNFIDYIYIQYLGFFLHFIGLFCVYRYTRKLSPFLSKSLVLSFVLYGFITLWQSLPFYFVYFVTYISVVILIVCKKEWYEYIFFINGIVISFFDFLTAPLITLGIPLLIVYSREKGISIKDIAIFSFIWGAGYACFWLAKPLIASFILNKNLFLDFIQQAAFRIDGGKSYYFQELPIRWVACYLNGRILILMLPIILYFYKELHWKKDIGIPLLLIALMPFAWVCALANHSAVHFWFTSRIFIISCFSFFVYIDMIRKDSLLS